MKNVLLLASVVVLLLLAACGQAPAASGAASPLKVLIEAKEFAYSPNVSTVKVGQAVEIELKNAGMILHDFSIMKIGLDGKAIAQGDEHMGGSVADELPVHVAAEADHTGTVKFTPTEAGEYEFYCTVAGHKAAGMVGKLIVVKQ